MDDREDRALLVASFRYRIIAEAAEAEGEGVTAAVKTAATTEWMAPWGAHEHFSQRQTDLLWATEQKTAVVYGFCTVIGHVVRFSKV
jgi:hypothetical protein